MGELRVSPPQQLGTGKGADQKGNWGEQREDQMWDQMQEGEICLGLSDTARVVPALPLR